MQTAHSEHGREVIVYSLQFTEPMAAQLKTKNYKLKTGAAGGRL